MKSVARLIANSLLSGLMVMTMLWGGCVACPQFYMLPFAKKDCCKAGHCEKRNSPKTPVAKACNRMPLEQPVAAYHHAELPLAVDAAPDSIVTMGTQIEGPRFLTLVEHSPPDLNVLHSTFLI